MSFLDPKPLTPAALDSAAAALAGNPASALAGELSATIDTQIEGSDFLPVAYAPKVIQPSPAIRHMADDAVMASPPTITATASQPAAMTQVRQVDTFGFDKWSGFRVSGGPLSSTRFPIGITSGSTTVAPGQPTVIEFDFEGTSFAWACQAQTTSFFHLWVNEERYAATATKLNSVPGVTGTGTHYFSVTFPARRKARIRIEIVRQPDQNNSFNGLFFAPTASVLPPAIPSPRLFVVGDSYAYGVGGDVLNGTAASPLTTDTTQAWPYQLGRIMGYADVWNWAAIPSTGFKAVHPGNAAAAYGERYASMLPYIRSGDILILQGSINDGAAGIVGQVQAQIVADIAYLRENLPAGVLIAITSPLYMRNATSGHIDAYNATKAGALEAGVPFLDVFDPTMKYFYGTGRVDAPTGDGNADYYGANEGANPSQHPSKAGHKAIAKALAPKLASVIGASVGDPLETALQGYASRANGWANIPPALYALDAALAKNASAPATIVGLGDSLWEGLSAAVYAESIPGRAAAGFRSRYGIGGGGVGFIPAAWPLEGDPVAPQDMIPTTTGTVTKATGATAGLGPGRKSIQLSPGATITFPAVTCTGYDIIYATAISSGQSFTYAHPGLAATSVSLSSTRTTLTAATAIGDTVLPVAAVPADWYPGVNLSVETSGGQIETAYIASISGLNVTLKTALTKTHDSGVPVGAHSNGGYIKQVRGLSASSRAVTITAVTNATIEGIRYYNGDEASGVHWINAGHGGIRADQLKLTGNSDRSMQTIGAVAPAAVFCDLMINDSGVQTPDQFIGHLTQLKADVLAACAARGVATPSWVQVIPYKIDNPTGRYQGRDWSEYVNAVYAWAKADTTGPGGASGVHVIDLGRRMPGSNTDATGLYNADKIHPSSAGAGQFVNWMVSALPISQ